MKNPSKIHAILILTAYGIGVLILLLAIHTPFSIPCLFKLVTGLPCPGCGLTRSFALAGQLNFIGAITANILFLPLAAGMAAFLLCALQDAFFGKQTMKRFNVALKKKWVIAPAGLLAAASWLYNIAREFGFFGF